VRERLRVRGMIRGLTAEGRMQANILTVLPVAVFAALWVLKRNYADAMLSRPQLLLGITASQVVGILWIRRIIRVNF
jgi:tight adherence protein B